MVRAQLHPQGFSHTERPAWGQGDGGGGGGGTFFILNKLQGWCSEREGRFFLHYQQLRGYSFSFVKFHIIAGFYMTVIMLK